MTDEFSSGDRRRLAERFVQAQEGIVSAAMFFYGHPEFGDAASHSYRVAQTELVETLREVAAGNFALWRDLRLNAMGPEIRQRLGLQISKIIEQNLVKELAVPIEELWGRRARMDYMDAHLSSPMRVAREHSVAEYLNVVAGSDPLMTVEGGLRVATGDAASAEFDAIHFHLINEGLLIHESLGSGN